MSSPAAVTVLVGQRGVGKTDLLERLKSYLPQAIFWDLDQEIAQVQERPIGDVFSEVGEEAFRKLEKEHLARLLSQTQPGSRYFIAVGAGFEGELPANVHCLWIRRLTDESGRIFLDRPRLNPAISAYEEGVVRSQLRKPRFAAMADDELTLLEGFVRPYAAERMFFCDEISGCGGAVTVPATVFARAERAPEYLAQRLRWGVRTFELRDDWLTSEQIAQATALLPADRVLYSFRLSADAPIPTIPFDWPIEWGRRLGAAVYSLHDRHPLESLPQAIKRLEQASAWSQQPILKLAPLIHSFAELALGHQWVSEDPQHRAFLPRSETGRWQWYRLLMKNRMALNFWREGEGSSWDQPFLLEWLNHDFTTRWFAAVLGDPVDHSWTPAVHFEYFGQRGLPVLKIPVSTAQWQANAFAELEKLGLRYAAVTSPLKELAFARCGAVSERARQFASVNTLKWSPEGWLGANTDDAGLTYLLRDIADKHVAVWGGGGTLKPLYAHLPQGQFFSARTRLPRNGDDALEGFQPEVVVWAVGRPPMEHLHWPPPTWRPELIIDLNYAENSPGREYALTVGAAYRSGREMFFEQAQHQQIFWK